jgi:hypothetical protein
MSTETAERELPQDHVSRLERLLHQHLWHVQAFTRWADGESPTIEFVDLTATSPSFALQDVSLAKPCASLAVINPTPVAVSVGWAGNRAAAGLGIAVPANSYIVLPVETNYVDIAASPAALAADVEINVIVFEYRTRQRLSAGGLGGAGGGPVTVTATSPGAVTVGVASALILPANINRNGLQAVNASANAISIGLGHAAVLGQDIWLAASGGAWDGTISGKLWLGSLFAIAAGAGSDLALTEV